MAAGFVEELSCAIAGWRDAAAIDTNRATISTANLFFM
jgi:hypothetical protein